MIGLPPDPPTVLRMTWVYDVSGSICRTSTAYWTPTLDSYSFVQLGELADNVAFWWLGLTAALTCTDVQLAEFRSGRASPVPWSRVVPAAPNHGEWPNRSTLNACLDVYWLAQDGGKRGHAITHFPGFPPDFTDDTRNLNSNGFVNVRTAVNDYLEGLSGVPTPDDEQLFQVVVHRRASGVALDHATITPIEAGHPTAYVGTLRRRVRERRRISPD